MPDKQNVRLFLNGLDAAAHGLKVPEAGKWFIDGSGYNFLESYARGIQIEGDVRDIRKVHSVPSAFARPILFSQALGSNASDAGNDPAAAQLHSPLHKAVQAQWRGLMGLFALKDYFAFDLTMEEFKVPSRDDLVRMRKLSAGVRDLKFLTILREQMPKPEAIWEQCWLIRCDGRLVGATSPWTVVYTPAEYSCPASIPWRDKNTGLLGDPLGYLATKNGKQEITALARWVERMIGQHEDHDSWDLAHDRPKVAASLKRELEIWLAEIRILRPEAVKGELGEPFEKDLPAPYRYFLRGSHLDQSGLFLESDLFLWRPDGNNEKILVFSRQGVSEKTRVFNSTFGDQVDLATMKAEGQSNWAAISGVKVPYRYLVAEDLFFPARLLKIPLSDEARQFGTNEYAVPLEAAFFSYFRPGDVAGDHPKVTLTVTEQQKRKVKAELRIPLKSGSNLTVTREYDLQRDIDELEGPAPAAAVWPNFQSPSWHSNLCAFAGPVGRAKDFPLSAEPILADGKVLQRTTLREQDFEAEVRIWESRTPIAGMGFWVKPKGWTEWKSCGMVLNKVVELNATDNRETWSLGVDFGTSNTVIKRKLPGGDIKLLDLPGRTRLLTKADAGLQSALLMNFYPNKPVVAPFVTALSQTGARVLEGSFKYVPVFSVVPDQAERLVRNLKWGSNGGQADDEPMQEYLKSLVRYATCEALAARVGKVDFEWSFPLALPGGVKNAMKDFWRSISKSFCDPKVMTVRFSTDGIPESDAVCRELVSRPAYSSRVSSDGLSIMIDVGGGSTDIGYWTQAELKDQVSFKLAGNDILAESIVKQEPFVRALREACRLETNDDVLRAFMEKPAIMVNHALASARLMNDEAFGSGHPFEHPVVVNMKNRAQPPWLQIRSLAYLFFTGVSFFAGLQARKYLPKKTDARREDVFLFFGGRGSALLTWLASDPEIIKAMLTKSFRAGLGQDVAATAEKVYVGGSLFDNSGESLPLKQEVAKGLLLPPIGKPALAEAGAESSPISNGDLKQVIVGEELCILPGNPTPLKFFDMVSAEQMQRLILPDHLDAMFFPVFTNGALKQNLANLNLDEANLQRLLPDRGHLQEVMRRAAGPYGVLQPVFVCELAAAMEQFARNSTGRAATAG